MVNVGRLEILIVIFVLCVMALLVAGAVLALVVWAARRSGRQSPPASQGAPAPPGTAAREILQARYARGEISREQYLSMLDDLEKH